MRVIFLAIALVALCVQCARAETTVGIEGLVINGSHTAQAGSTPVSGVAPMLKLRQRWKALDLTLEGIPPISGRSYLMTSSDAPQPLTDVSIFNALAHVAIGPSRRFWLGGGIVVINQQTSLLSPPLAAASRVTGSRYEALAYLPSGPMGTVELRAAYMPAMHGSLNYQLGRIPVPPGYDSEVAEATDWTAEYVLHLHRVALGAGVRNINYVAHFVSPYALADRNTSFGAMLEVRFGIAR